MQINKIIIILLFFYPVFSSFSQETKKIINIDSMQARTAFAEEFYVLVSDGITKQGLYQKISGGFHDKGTILQEGHYENGLKQGLWTTRLWEGNYENDKKVGTWYYYKYNKEVELIYNHTTNKVIQFTPPINSTYKLLQNGQFIDADLDTVPILYDNEQVFFLGEGTRYPMSAFHKRISGIVLVFIIIDEKGNVIDSGIEKGLGYGLDEEALRVVRLARVQQKFIPAKKDGKPVTVKMIIPVTFRLE